MGRKTKLPLLEFAPWSPSKASKASQCPLAFRFHYVDRLPRGRSSEAALVGTVVHHAQELVLQGAKVEDAISTAVANSRDPLTSVETEKVGSYVAQIEDFGKRIQEFNRKHGIKKLLLEQEWAIDDKFKPVSYKSKKAMMRGIVDLAILTDAGALVIIDHKSGKKKSVREYGAQLDIYKVMGLAHVPEAKSIQCAIHFLVDGDVVWEAPNKPSRIRELLQPWLIRYLSGCHDGLEGFEPKVSYLCNWCDFQSHCPEGGKSKRT